MDWLYPGFFFWHSILDGFSTKCPCSDQRSPKRIQFGNKMALPPHVRANDSPITKIQGWGQPPKVISLLLPALKPFTDVLNPSSIHGSHLSSRESATKDPTTHPSLSKGLRHLNDGAPGHSLWVELYFLTFIWINVCFQFAYPHPHDFKNKQSFRKNDEAFIHNRITIA